LRNGTATVFGDQADVKTRKELGESLSRLDTDGASAGAVALPSPIYVAAMAAAGGGFFLNIIMRKVVGSKIANEKEIIEKEIAKDEPNVLVVAKSARRLQEIQHWLAGKGDAFAESFAKSLGTSAAVAAVLGLTEMLGPVTHVIHAAEHWLRTVTGL
jgi:hypothetical protein